MSDPTHVLRSFKPTKEFFIGMDEECERVSKKLEINQNPEAQIVILDIASKVSKFLENGKHTKYIESIAHRSGKAIFLGFKNFLRKSCDSSSNIC